MFGSVHRFAKTRLTYNANYKTCESVFVMFCGCSCCSRCSRSELLLLLLLAAAVVVVVVSV